MHKPIGAFSNISKKTVVIIVLLFLSGSSVLQAQVAFPYWKLYKNEFSFGVGVSNFLGDIGGAEGVGENDIRDFNFGATRWAFTGGFRHKISQYFALRSNLTAARVSGSDALSSNEYRSYRNLSFRTSIYEANLTLEMSIFKESLGHRYKLRMVRGRKAYEIYTYFFAGVGVFYFNPQASYNGVWRDLRPLSTEGQGLVATRKPYSQTQLCIPFGIGFKYNFNKKWGAAFEAGYRYTFTDYIDDVSKTYFDNDFIRTYKGPNAAALADRSDHSVPVRTAAGEQRGNPNNKDGYLFGTISISYKLRSKKYGKFIDLPTF